MKSGLEVVFWLMIELLHVVEDAFKQVDPCLPGKFVICLNEASMCLLKVRMLSLGVWSASFSSCASPRADLCLHSSAGNVGVLRLFGFSYHQEYFFQMDA